MNARNYLSTKNDRVIHHNLNISEPTCNKQLSLPVLSGRDSVFFSMLIDKLSQFFPNWWLDWFFSWFFLEVRSEIFGWRETSLCNYVCTSILVCSTWWLLFGVQFFCCSKVLMFRLRLHFFYLTPQNKITFSQLKALRKTENHSPFHTQCDLRKQSKRLSGSVWMAYGLNRKIKAEGRGRKEGEN